MREVSIAAERIGVEVSMMATDALMVCFGRRIFAHQYNNSTSYFIDFIYSSEVSGN